MAKKKCSICENIVTDEAGYSIRCTICEAGVMNTEDKAEQGRELAELLDDNNSTVHSSLWDKIRPIVNAILSDQPTPDPFRKKAMELVETIEKAAELDRKRVLNTNAMLVEDWKELRHYQAEIPRIAARLREMGV